MHYHENWARVILVALGVELVEGIQGVYAMAQ